MQSKKWQITRGMVFVVDFKFKGFEKAKSKYK